MRSALATLPSTYQVGFDHDRDEVYVSYDATAGDATTASDAMITAVVTKAGFRAWLKGPGWPSGVDAPPLGVTF